MSARNGENFNLAVDFVCDIFFKARTQLRKYINYETDF